MPGAEELIEAAKCGDVGAVQALLDAGVPPDAANERGIEALAVAAGTGRLAVMELLIERGADVNASGPLGVTPLGIALRPGNEEAVRLLLEAGVDPNGTGEQRGVHLFMAVMGQHHQLAAILLLAGANANLVTRGGSSPLLSALLQRDLDMIRILLEHGADPDRPVQPGNRTPLALAISLGHQRAAADMLVDHGADVSALKDDWLVPDRTYKRLTRRSKKPVPPRTGPVPRPALDQLRDEFDDDDAMDELLGAMPLDVPVDQWFAKMPPEELERVKGMMERAVGLTAPDEDEQEPRP